MVMESALRRPLATIGAQRLQDLVCMVNYLREIRTEQKITFLHISGAISPPGLPFYICVQMDTQTKANRLYPERC